MHPVAKMLSFEDTKHLLRRYSIDIVESEVCHAKHQAVETARRYGFPVVLKAVSPHLIHKTDVGGVMINLRGPEEVMWAFDQIHENIKKKAKGIRLEGILVQKQLEGHEIIIGGKRDPQFGPVVLFGMGGIFVEIFHDVSIMIAPITKEDAMRMISEIKGFKVLEGARGQKSANLNEIALMITKVSNLMMNEDYIRELDLNPCFAGNKCTAVDYRVIVE